MSNNFCVCGHEYKDHVPLPGHPGGAMECYGSDDCECGEFRQNYGMAALDSALEEIK